MERTGLTEASAISSREKYVRAWNDTMIKIWQEKITLLNVIDTGHLLRSVVALPVHADGRFVDINLSQEFGEYGLWQNYGTGRETPRKGRQDESKYRNADGTLIDAVVRTKSNGETYLDKVREKRPWFSRSYYASVMALKDFLSESIGEEFIGMLSDIFDEKELRKRYGN